jgi:hypothetical protein
MVQVIELDTPVTNCGVCEKEIPLVNGGFCLPMYEGKVVKNDNEEWAGTPVCKDCYNEHLE